MRWLILLLMAYVFVVLEQGLSLVFDQPGKYNFAPGMLLILLVYVGMFAPPMMVLWTGIILGLLHDLSHPVKLTGELADAAIMGPAALAYLLGAVAMLQIRGVVYRGSPLSIALFSFIIGIIVHLAFVLIFMLRGLPMMFFPGEQVIQWSWSAELVGRFFSLLTTFAVALPLGWLLLRFGSAAFGTDVPKSGSGRW
jgi:hypothetical protein